MNTQQNYALPAGHRLTLTSYQGGGERVWQLPDGARQLVPATGFYSIGPFANDREYAVAHSTAAPAVSVAVSTINPLGYVPTTIAADRYEVIPADHQLCAFGTFTVAGTLVVQGTLRVTGLPALA